MRKTLAQHEIEMFWRICQEFRSSDPVIASEAVDEMEALHDMTDSESLKAKCQKMMRVMSARATAGRAAG